MSFSYMRVKKGSGLVFTYFSQMASIAGLLTWFGIAVIYLRFYKGMKVQGMDRTRLPYYSKYQPFAAWYAVCSIFLILLVSHFLQFQHESVQIIVVAEWVGSLPQRTLGHLYLCHQLPCSDFVPHPVLGCQNQLQRGSQETG